ncbi:two-component sensor histidine kinase, partial [Hansschlegelia beijingensis]
MSRKTGFIGWLRRRAPRGLYTQSLIIIIAPMVLLQGVVAFVFLERHYELVTKRLSSAVSRDIAALVDLHQSKPPVSDAEIVRIARERLALQVEFLPPQALPPPLPRPFFSILDERLSEEIADDIKLPFWIDTVGRSNFVEIRIQLGDAVMKVLARRNQTYASNSHIFLIWMVGASLVLLGVAIYFLRAQLRPILALSEAAESFGKGRPEVRRRPALA